MKKAPHEAGLRDISENLKQADSTDPFVPQAPADTSVYVASNIKRRRRTKSALQSIRQTILEVVEEQQPMNVRQVFYQCSVRGVIDKTENEYQRTIVRLLGQMREDGDIPFDWIADNTRWMRKPSSFVGLEDFLENAAQVCHYGNAAAVPPEGGRSGCATYP